MRVEFVIHVGAAKSLGLKNAQSLRVHAHEVIPQRRGRDPRCGCRRQQDSRVASHRLFRNAAICQPGDRLT
jgi:hypothetical protein